MRRRIVTTSALVSIESLEERCLLSGDPLTDEDLAAQQAAEEAAMYEAMALEQAEAEAAQILADEQAAAEQAAMDEAMALQQAADEAAQQLLDEELAAQAEADEVAMYEAMALEQAEAEAAQIAADEQAAAEQAAMDEALALQQAADEAAQQLLEEELAAQAAAEEAAMYEQIVVVDDNVTVIENSTTYLDVLANDVDPTSSQTLFAVGSASNGDVWIDTITNQLIYTPYADFVGTDSFTYSFWTNASMGDFLGWVFVTVDADVPEPEPEIEPVVATIPAPEPAITSIAVKEETFYVTEDASIDDFINAIVVTDQNGNEIWEGITFTITAGNDGEAFKLGDASYELYVKGALDYEATKDYQLTITATLDAQATITDNGSIAIVVNNIDEPPTLSSGGEFTIEENTPATVENPFEIGTIVATDPDGNDITGYSIIAGSGPFIIDNNGKLSATAPLDKEAGAFRRLTIIATTADINNPDSPEGEFEVTVRVTNVNEVPVFDQQSYAFTYEHDDSSSSISVSEDVVIDRVKAIDPDDADYDASIFPYNANVPRQTSLLTYHSDDIPHPFSIVTKQGATDSTGEISILAAGNPTLIGNGVYTFTVYAKDQFGGQSESVEVTVTISGSRFDNDTIKAVDDSFTVYTYAATPTAPKVFTFDVLANDIEITPADDEFRPWIRGLSDPAHGTVTFGENGTLIYTPDTGYFGTDSFRYAAFQADPTGNIANPKIDWAEVSIEVKNGYGVQDSAIQLYVEIEEIIDSIEETQREIVREYGDRLGRALNTLKSVHPTFDTMDNFASTISMATTIVGWGESFTPWKLPVFSTVARFTLDAITKINAANQNATIEDKNSIIVDRIIEEKERFMGIWGDSITPHFGLGDQQNPGLRGKLKLAVGKKVFDNITTLPDTKETGIALRQFLSQLVVDEDLLISAAQDFSDGDGGGIGKFIGIDEKIKETNNVVPLSTQMYFDVVKSIHEKNDWTLTYTRVVKYSLGAEKLGEIWDSITGTYTPGTGFISEHYEWRSSGTLTGKLLAQKISLLITSANYELVTVIVDIPPIIMPGGTI